LADALTCSVRSTAFRSNRAPARRELVTINARPVPFIGLEDFKTNKRASGRLQDLADLESLEDKTADK